MDSAALQKRHRTLTGEAFDKLLASLDPDRDAAAGKYETIRRRLARFFEYRGCASPDDYADITLNCAAKKLSEGSEIYSRDPLSFFIGIARNILREYWEQAGSRAESLHDLTEAAHPFEDPAETMRAGEDREQSEMALNCLEQCLEHIADQDRELIVNYYVGEKSQKIENRKALMRKLGLAPANLRLRAFRLREKLETCVQGCLTGLAVTRNAMFAN